MALSEAAEMVRGTLHGDDARFSAVSIDTRTIGKNALFVAIPGERFDGHEYVSEAGVLGASGAMVSELQNSALPQILVKDTTQALGMLGSQWRNKFELPVAAITGSNGKTTVTAMVASVFRQAGSCLAPEKSFNNQWGVPLTLLKLNASHDFAVIEMGTNHQGEIDYLSRLARPTIVLINNVSTAHVEGLGEVGEIARAKAEIFSGLHDGGTAVLNADDDFYPYWRDRFLGSVNGGRLVTFGESEGAGVSFKNAELGISGCQFDLTIDSQSVPITLPLPGQHNIMNALASAAVAYVAGVGLDQIRSGLQAVKGVSGRLAFGEGVGGSTIIDDSYNANPESTKAAINVLGRLPGKKVAVLGIMAELGDAGPGFHNEIGAYAKAHGVSRLFCYEAGQAGLAQQYAAGFGKGSVVFNEIGEMIEAVRRQLAEDVVVLVKGSRSSRMERVVAGISDPQVPDMKSEVSQC